MPLTVSELQAKVSANTSEAERAFEQFNNVQKKVGETAKQTASEVEQAGKKIDESGKNASKSWENFSSKLGNLGSHLRGLGTSLTIGVTAPIIALGREAFNTAVRFDSLDRGLSAIMHGSKNAKIEFEKLKEVAKLPGLGMEEALAGSIKLQAAGLSADRARTSLMAFGNALATVGKGKADMDGVTLALSQISSKTKVLGQDVRQLQERVPQLTKIMLDAFGTADTQVLQKAEVSTKDFLDIIVTELNRLPKVTGGIQNEMENLSDKWKLMLKEMGIALFPFFEIVSQQLMPLFGRITEALNKMSPEQKNFLVWAGLATAAIGPFVLGLGAMATGINSLTQLMIAFGPTATAFSASINGIALGPIALIAGAIALLYLAWKNNWGGMRDTLNNTFSSMKKAVSEWTNSLFDSVKSWKQMISGFISWIQPEIQSFSMRFKIFWDTFWTGIGLVISTVFSKIKLAIDIALAAIQIIITTFISIITLDWKTGWETIKGIVSNTWDNIKQNFKDTFTTIQDTFKSWWNRMKGIAEEGGKNLAVAAAANPVFNPAAGKKLLSSHSNDYGFHLKPLSSHASTLPTIPDDKNQKPGYLPPANVSLGMIQDNYRNKIQEILNTPKKVKLTDEQKQTNAANKELAQSYKELNELKKGSISLAAQEAGKYNLVKKEIVDQLVAVKLRIKAFKDESDLRKKEAKEIADEALRFHDAVKAAEAVRRDLTKGTKENSLAAEFPNQKKSLIDYFAALKAGNKEIENTNKENARFKQTLSEVRGEISDLIGDNGIARLKAEFKNLVPDSELVKLNAANAQLKALQMLKVATDKMTILMMPKEEREAAGALGLDMWKSLTFEAKENTLAIFANIKANDELTKSIERANEQAEKRANTLKDFSASMSGRMLAAQANLAGDNATGLWQKMLAGNDSLRDAIGEGPTVAGAKAMKEFFEVFDEEARVKNILDTAEAMKRFNNQISENIKLSEIRLTGRGDSVEAEWQRFLLTNKNLADKFRLDVNEGKKAFEDFKRSFKLDLEATRLENFNKVIGDLEKEMGILSTTDPFEKFKISMMEMQNGVLTQVFSEEQLKQIFNMNRIIEFSNTLQGVFENAISNLKQGFGSFFSSIVQGFEAMLQDMARKWLASQLVSLVMRVIGTAIGVATGGTSSSVVGSAASGFTGGSGGFTGNVDTDSSSSLSYMKKGGDTHISMTVITPDANSFKQSQGQIMTDLQRQASYSSMKNTSKMNRERF